MPAILTTGELLIDFTPVRAENGAAALCPNPGGAPANVAVQLTRIGVPAGFIGKVGNDDFGRTLRDCLVENDVCTKNLIMDDEYRTTLAFVQLDKKGDRSFTFYRNPGADTQLRLDEIDMDAVKECSILHFGSLSLTTEPSKTTTLELVKTAKEMGKLISYDPNWRPPLWRSAEEGIAGMKLGLTLCDILKISEEELALLTGKEKVSEAVAELHALGAKLIIVTLGASGCAISFDGELRHLPTFDTKVIDTTGSGDSFWGAFLGKLYLNGYRSTESLSGLTMDELIGFCRFANGAGSVCATRSGGIPALANTEEIERCLKEEPILQTGFVLD